MIAFYIGLITLIISAVVFALWPLIKYRFLRPPEAAADIERQAVNITLYRDHLAELESALSQQAISRDQFTELKLELEKNLLEDSENALKKVRIFNRGGNGGENSNLYIGLIVVAIPIMAIGLYYLLGNKSGWELKALIEEQARLEHQLLADNASTTTLDALNQHNRMLVAKLEDHAVKHPEDLESKVLFARNAMGIGEYDKAIEAYQQILEKEPQAAQMMAELAQAVFSKADNRAVPVVGMLAQRALSIQPNNAMALGTMGLFHYQNGQYRDAIKFWQQALNVYSPDSPNARALHNGITQAQARLTAQSEQEQGGEQAQAATSNEAESSASATGSSIKVAVSLAKAVPFKPSDTIFIYARAWKGAKVPLAIARISASQLPLTIELNDTMSMAPGMTLSSAETVEVVARLSTSGNAIAQAGDWQVTLGPVKPRSTEATVYPLIISEPYKP
jgi:cytochrome c-type biogenesis protein CcmH